MNDYSLRSLKTLDMMYKHHSLTYYVDIMDTKETELITWLNFLQFNTNILASTSADSAKGFEEEMIWS